MYKLYDWKEKIEDNELRDVVNVLKSNGIIVFPTETVYGIGGNAISKDVIDKVYTAKRRPREKALCILVPSINEIEKYADITSEIERKIINKFMPGPITLILRKKKHFGDYFSANDDTIGIRIPDNKIINTILNNIDFPLIAPSANISGKISGVRVCDIVEDFKNSADIIIDGGDAKLGLSSTIVKVENNNIQILREGKISKEDILKKII